MTTAKVWVRKGAFVGEPKLDDFLLTEETLPVLKQDEILIEAVFLSVDPYFRNVPAQDDLPSEQVARIIDSQAEGFPKGALVTAHVGWRSRTVVNVAQPGRFGSKIEVIEEVPGLSPSLWLGAAGMPGVTAYMAFIERCSPKSGEILVVSAASGAVGTVVGQLAKLRGLTVIGIAGSDEKCKYIKELGFDHAINYKKENVSEALEKAAPDGVDIYYDNVGGDISDAVYSKLRLRGRVLICGQIAHYNDRQETGINWNMQILAKELMIIGYNVYKGGHVPEFPRVRKELIPLLKEGKLKAKEHTTEGFENMPKAFIELFSGSNVGKAIVKANIVK